MIKISKARIGEELISDWQKLDNIKYGSGNHWFEKRFRFKATENGRLLGTIDGKFEPGIVYIGTMMTTEKARGKGIGTKLINYVEGLGKKLGTHRIWLYTGKDWQANLFYKKLGFKMGTLYQNITF